MQPRDYVLRQLGHRATTPVPYSLPLGVAEQKRLDEFYGSRDWRQRGTEFITWLSPYDCWPQTAEGEGRFRDVYGSLWQQSVNGFHQIEPGCKNPTLAGYKFPVAEQFIPAGAWARDEEIRKANADRFTVIALSWGLFERSWQIRGFENVLLDAASEPEFYGQLLDKVTELLLGMTESVKDMPADALMIGDNWGYQHGVTLGPDRWRKFLKPRWQRIFAAIHAQGKATIVHCDGRVTELMPDLVEIGLDVLESVQPEAMDPYELKREWGKQIAFWGALGCQSTLTCGTPQTIKAEVAKLCREMGQGGGYILAPSKPPLPDTPTANIAAAWEAFVEQPR